MPRAKAKAKETPINQIIVKEEKYQILPLHQAPLPLQCWRGNPKRGTHQTTS